MSDAAREAMTQAEVTSAFGLNNQQAQQLVAYVAALRDWSNRMNLVAASTLPDVWDRHVADSAQLAALVETTTATTWLDIGSGAGFPALVLATLSLGSFHLVEATAKKCQFLAAAAAEMNLTERVSIHNTRVETLAMTSADIVTARACARLNQLFAWGGRFSPGLWLLLKGRTAESEVAEARRTFDFDAELIVSRTNREARIVVARNVRRKRR